MVIAGTSDYIERKQLTTQNTNQFLTTCTIYSTTKTHIQSTEQTLTIKYHTCVKETRMIS